jgi:hypothetical protein
MKKLMILIFIALPTIFINGQDNLKLIHSKMTVNGTSSMHDWTMSAENVSLNGDLLLNGRSVDNFRNITVMIEAASLKSEKGSIMEKNTYKALKASEHPKIKFELLKSQVTSMEGNRYKIKSTGVLSVAGVSNNINLEATLQALPSNQWKLTGKKELSMADYGIEAPKFLMGTLKTGDLVTIEFDLTLSATDYQASVGN